MRLGIVPVLTRPNGGMVQYSLMVLEALRRLNRQAPDDALVLFASRTREIESLIAQMPTWTVRSPEPPGWLNTMKPVLRRLVLHNPGRQVWRRLKEHLAEFPLTVDAVPSDPNRARWYQREHVDLMLYTTHTPLAFEVGIPYVMAIHDVAHRLHPEFAEICGGLFWEWAEHACRNGARHARLLLADSEVGREDILECYGRYGVIEDRVKVLPFVPPPYLKAPVSDEESLRVQMKYGLPSRYLFYPADLSPHKNQAQILRALALLKDEYRVTIPIALCGYRGGSHREEYFAGMQAFARRQGLQESVRYLNYVPDEDMSALYAGATALVIPILIGPTTIPIYEAWACHCPVLTSDIRGIREQAGDAALLVNPRSVDEVAEGIHRLWTDDALRQTLVVRGTRRLALFTCDDFYTRLGGILAEATRR